MPDGKWRSFLPLEGSESGHLVARPFELPSTGVLSRRSPFKKARAQDVRAFSFDRVKKRGRCFCGFRDANYDKRKRVGWVKFSLDFLKHVRCQRCSSNWTPLASVEFPLFYMIVPLVIF